MLSRLFEIKFFNNRFKQNSFQSKVIEKEG